MGNVTFKPILAFLPLEERKIVKMARSGVGGVTYSQPCEHIAWHDIAKVEHRIKQRTCNNTGKFCQRSP